jgi:hypothetical protein
MNHPDAEKEPMATREQDRNLLRDSIHILMLYPSDQLSPHARAVRILHDRALARARFQSCSESALASRQAPLPQSGKPGNPQPAPNLQALTSLGIRWEQEPERPTVQELEKSPRLQQSELQLIYDTEIITAAQCGTPTGDDALLLKIAQAPDAVEEQ